MAYKVKPRLRSQKKSLLDGEADDDSGKTISKRSNLYVEWTDAGLEREFQDRARSSPRKGGIASNDHGNATYCHSMSLNLLTPPVSSSPASRSASTLDLLAAWRRTLSSWIMSSLSD